MPKPLHPLLQPFAPTSDEPFDATRAAHLLNRAGFGGTADEVAETQKLGPRDAVDRLLDFPDAPAEELSRTDVPDLSAIADYPKTFAERRALYEGKTPQERQEINQKLQRGNREAVGATVRWWLNRMADGPHPLQEKLTLFWHGHFTTSARDERSAWLMWQQNETLRRHAADDFGAFAKAISRDPAMLDYLNAAQNRKGRPNENYARELMELFTLGIGSYTEQDVKEAARAFTGWAHDGDDYVFRKGQHDDGEKQLFGVRGKLGGDDVIDLILRHDRCAPYVAGRLLRYFAYDAVPPELDLALGRVLRDNGYRLRPTLRVLLTSRAFYSAAAVGTQIKSPIQLVVGASRQLGLDGLRVRGGGMQGAFEQMGQVPLMPPNVKGWPGGRAWINTSTLFVRMNTAIELTRQVKDGDLIPADARDGGALVDAWVGRLIQRPIGVAQRDKLVEAAGPKPNARSARKLLELIVSMPEFQLC